MTKNKYKKYGKERYIKEDHTTSRDEFQRDKGRIIHSSFFRKMGAKTQVITKSSLKTFATKTNKNIPEDFVRTRLTHSLEVAQIGGEIASNFELNVNLAEAVCLAHDIGHPPFGHSGEVVLNELSKNIGGFEGNAQTFRVLTRLENKKYNENGRSFGLNLTRGVLNGIIKYPWELKNSFNNKFNVYLPDIKYFNWVRKYSEKLKPTIYAQIMDFADDVAYSVNDVEDTIITTKYNLNEFTKSKEKIIKIAENYFQNTKYNFQIEKTINGLLKLEFWDSNISKIADIKNFTSELIERFVKSVKIHDNDLIVPQKTKLEISALKAFSFLYLINTDEQIKLKIMQKKLITKVFKGFVAKPHLMSQNYYDEYKKAKNNNILKQRIIIDQIASLTDESIKAIV